MSINFGFSILKDATIDLDKIHCEAYEKIHKEETSIALCIQCGTCSATCSAAKFTDFSLRSVFLNLRRGQITSISKEINKCFVCGKCKLVCPRGVNTRNAIITIKRYFENSL